MLAGCGSTSHPMGKPLPTLSYSHLEPYSPYQGSVDIRQSAQLTPKTKQALEQFVLMPDLLIKQYASKRFLTPQTAPNRPVKAVFDIQKLAFSKKTDADNVVGILSGAAADYYTMDLLIALHPVAPDGRLTQPYTIKIKRELLIPDQTSLAQKEVRQFEFLEKVISDIDKTITGFMPNMR